MISAAPLPTKIDSGARSSTRPSLAAITRILRRVQLQEGPKLSGADHFAVEVHQEQLGGVGIGQEAGVDLQPQLGNELGESPRARGMSARLVLEPLESIDQGAARAG